MNKLEWRPQNPFEEDMPYTNRDEYQDHLEEHMKHGAFEAGASAMLKALIKKIIDEYGDPDLNEWLKKQGLWSS